MAVGKASEEMMKGATILAKRLLEDLLLTGLNKRAPCPQGSSVISKRSLNQQEPTMDKTEFENWSKVKAGLEAAGKTDCYYYQRAVQIVGGGSDPLDVKLTPVISTRNNCRFVSFNYIQVNAWLECLPTRFEVVESAITQLIERARLTPR